MEKTAYSHCSTQFELGSRDAKPFLDFAASVRDEDLYTEGDEHGRETVPHVTVLYGIHEYDPKAVADLVRHRQPVRVRFGAVSCFDADDYDVLKVEVSSSQLHSLHEHLKARLDNSYKFPDYHPHLTIAYLKKGKGKEYEGDDRFRGRELTFNRLRHTNKAGGEGALITLTGERVNPWTKRADDTRPPWTPILEALQGGETGGETNPWVRTRHAPPGGSSAYGPLQLTAHTVRDYVDRKPEIFEDTGEFPTRFLGQAQQFLRYGNEPGREGYHARYDYGGHGDHGSDPAFRDNYMRVAMRILRDKLGERGDQFLEDGVLQDEELATVGRVWHGSPVDDGYLQRMRDRLAALQARLKD